jgi:CxxC motif-containing protein (DUF1111 family)
MHTQLTMVSLLISLVLGIMMASGSRVVASAELTSDTRLPSSFGDPLPGLTPAQLNQFVAGQDEFEEEETAADGLGPLFNNTSCAACHSSPAVGGDNNILETRFGRMSKKKYDPMIAFGGPLLQSQGISPAGACFGETVPPEATIVAQRKTGPLFGLGLVDHVPDDVFEQIAKDQKQNTPAVAGTPHMVIDVATGKKKVGRFGWKAQVATLETFAGDAYLNEMGITNPLFPTENAPQGDASLLTTCDTVPGLEDDGTGIQAFTDFMTFLGPPPRGPITPHVQAGQAIFHQIGCASCHSPALETGPSAVAALDQVTFQPFSDFLLHDMGTLGDGIEQGLAKGYEMRTAPLWGLRVRTRFLHDGSTATLEEAILGHEGQGQYARDLFKQLNPAEMQVLIGFLNSL